MTQFLLVCLFTIRLCYWLIVAVIGDIVTRRIASASVTESNSCFYRSSESPLRIRSYFGTRMFSQRSNNIPASRYFSERFAGPTVPITESYSVRHGVPIRKPEVRSPNVRDNQPLSEVGLSIGVSKYNCSFSEYFSGSKVNTPRYRSSAGTGLFRSITYSDSVFRKLN